MQRQLNINTSVSLKLMVYFNRCIFCNDDPLLQRRSIIDEFRNSTMITPSHYLGQPFCKRKSKWLI